MKATALVQLGWSVVLLVVGVFRLITTRRSGARRVAAMPWAALVMAGVATAEQAALGDGPVPLWLAGLGGAFVVSVGALMAKPPSRR